MWTGVQWIRASNPKDRISSFPKWKTKAPKQITTAKDENSLMSFCRNNQELFTDCLSLIKILPRHTTRISPICTAKWTQPSLWSPRSTRIGNWIRLRTAILIARKRASSRIGTAMPAATILISAAGRVWVPVLVVWRPGGFTHRRRSRDTRTTSSRPATPSKPRMLSREQRLRPGNLRRLGRCSTLTTQNSRRIWWSPSVPITSLKTACTSKIKPFNLKSSLKIINKVTRKVLKFV